MKQVEGVLDLYPEPILKKGSAVISHVEVDNSIQWQLQNMRAVRDGGSIFHVYPGKYIRLHIDGELVMSDTTMERASNAEFVEQAHGRVLIAGLGLGLVLKNILDKPDVASVTVIEKSQDVVDLVANKFAHKKLTVICADIFEWRPGLHYSFETIYFDIWPSINIENLDDIKRLHNTFKYYKAKGGWMNSWMKKFLQKEKRKQY